MISEIKTENISADIIIVGAGLVGLAAAIALTLQHKNVVLVSSYQPTLQHAFKQNAWDERVYALTPATESWLMSLGVWQYVDQARVSNIDGMQIWGADSDLLLKSEDANLVKLGLIAENQNLMNALWQKVQALGITVVTDVQCVDIEYEQAGIALCLQHKADSLVSKVNAKLLIAADGIHSWIRQKLNIRVLQKNYQQTAIIANFLAEKAHHNIARQWFSPHETLAMLPLPDKYVSMVWSLSTQKAADLLTLSSSGLSERVQTQSHDLLGGLLLVGSIKSVALQQQTVAQLIAERVVFIGDAAHQIHPMAGQGVNLGFRDVMKLTALSTKLQPMHDIGEKGFLRQYERARKADVVTMNNLTSGLDYLFASEQTLLIRLTHFGLHQMNRQSAIKKMLINQAVS